MIMYYDDPDDRNDNEGQDEFFYADEYGDVEFFDDDLDRPYECRMCGNETDYLDDAGNCSWCHNDIHP